MRGNITILEILLWKKKSPLTLAQFKNHPIKMKRDVLQELSINKTRGQN